MDEVVDQLRTAHISIANSEEESIRNLAIHISIIDDMEATIQQKPLHLHSPASILTRLLNKVILSARRGSKHSRQTILSRVRNARREHIQHPSNNSRPEVSSSSITPIQWLVTPIKKRVTYHHHRNALPCIAKYLRPRDQKNIVIRILGYSWDIWLCKGATIVLSRIHTQICSILNNDSVVLSRRLANDRQLLLRKGYP